MSWWSACARCPSARGPRRSRVGTPAPTIRQYPAPVSRREMIRMTDAEVAEFMASERVVTCASAGPRGWPHLMPLWYVVREVEDGGPGPRLWAWTYAASQKVRNIERDPRATLLLEAGEAYAELRGVMLECEVQIHRELEIVARLGEELMLRNALPPGSEPL